MQDTMGDHVVITIGKSFLEKHGMTSYKGHRALLTHAGEIIHLLRGTIVPGKSAIRCMIEQGPDGYLHPPRLLSRSEKKSLRKLLAKGKAKSNESN
jgi:hypothetical protein